jgi:hypothetical protein
VLGRRDSLRELIRNQHEETQDLIRNQHEETQDLIREIREEGARRHEEFLRLQTKREEEFRDFMRETSLRHDKVYGPMIIEMEESRKQLRANTEAVLSLLDRFNEPGAATA